ncbi:recombinase family protein [Oscillibacter sp. 1-3]|uniref:recombinase family protein n=1 Tax=Oscillibacter sp. 1-3 TaxID=1235797 RepID=UPI001FA72D1E|nr:recombinase family protein [Oscillibacter sp. 1-3]
MKPDTLRVAAYCRVSSDSSDQLHSYAAQIRAYTEKIGNHEGWELVDIYADEGLTGTRMDKREDFHRMLDHCRKGRIDKILVKSISRFARNTKDCLASLRELTVLGVSVDFEENHISTETLTTELMVSVFGALAQQESVSISQNQRMSYQRRMERGEFITTKAPFGYRLKDGKNLEIAEDEAWLIRKIFGLYLCGIGTEEIAKAVTQTGVRTRDGHAEWNHVGINYILRNEKYIGDALCQKTLATDSFPFAKKRNEGEKDQYYVDGTHPAIISKDTFQRVQRLLNTRSQHLDGPYKVYPLSKKILCGVCGSTFVRKASPSGYVSWVCRKHNESAVGCPIGRIAESEIYAAFVRMYNKLRLHEGVILKPALAQLRDLNDALQRSSPAMLAVNKAIAEATEQSYKVATLQSRGLLDAAACTAKLRTIECRLTELRRERRRLLKNEDLDETMETLRQTVNIIRGGPERLEDFDEILFADLVERITAESQTQVRFRLYGGIELTEQLREARR